MHEDECQRRVGTVIRDKWTLVRLLGTGGMAAVYVGVHRIGRRDALKILHTEAAKSKEVCLRFEREAQAVNRFRHPGAVEIRDIDMTEDGAPFLVMELLVGESLADRTHRLGVLSPGEVLTHALDVLDVLVAAHAQGIIHRDVKPANLFVTRDGGLKVLDFGLARMHEVNTGDGLFTKEGTTLGTTPYMPPEQARGQAIDARADLFAVGATMFRVLTGRYIHEASTGFDLLMKMGRDPAPSITKYAPNLPEPLCMVIDRALIFDRAQRYPDAETMLEDVRAAARGDLPPFALRVGGRLRTERPEVDRNASTLDDVIVLTRDEASSDAVPIVMSGFSSEVISVVETDPTPSPEPESLDSAALEEAPDDDLPSRRRFETTLISPGNEPSTKPPKTAR